MQTQKTKNGKIRKQPARKLSHRLLSITLAYHRSDFYAFLLPTLLSFQCSAHLCGVGSFSNLSFINM